MWSMWKEEKKEMRGALPYGLHICLTKYWIVKLLGHSLSYNSKSCWTWLTPFQNVSLWDVEKNLEYTQHLVWMGRNFILFQFVRLVRDLFQFNDPGILYTSNNKGNFWQERKLMSRQIKLRPTKMDHILNFLSLFVPCTRLTVNAWRIKVEHLI